MKEERTLFWYQNLTGGMDQATDSAVVSNNDSPLLKNVVLDKTGCWSSRKGTVLLGSTTAGSDRVWGLGAYNKSDGTHTFFRICNRDIEKFDGTTGWDVTDADEFTASKKVNMINFLDRLYYGCEDGTTALAYSVAAGTLTDVVPTIGGHCLGVCKSVLAVGGNSILPNVILTTDPFTDQFFRRFTDGATTATCAADANVGGTGYVDLTAEVMPADCTGGLLYNTTLGEMNLITHWVDADTVITNDKSTTANWDDDTVYLINWRNNFAQDGEVTGIIGFQETFVSFDEDKMYIWDPVKNWSEEIPGFGCVNERTIQIVEGNLIWVDREGVYLWRGRGTMPVDITGKIRDKVDGYGIWDLIAQGNWVQLAAGSFEGKYYLSLGDLSTLSGAPASALTNVELVFDLAKGSWTISSRDDEPVVYAPFIGRGDSSANKDLYFGEKTNLATYRMNTGTTDATSAGATATIGVDMRTPYFVFDDPVQDWRIEEYYVKYRAGDTVTVAQSIDEGTYSTVDTIAASSTTKIDKILPLAEAQGKSFSLKFTCTGTFTLYAVGFQAVPISFGKVSA